MFPEKISPGQLAELLRRVNLVMDALKMSRVAVNSIGAFVEHPGPWSASALSEYIGVRRPTLLRHLARYEKKGLVQHDADGWRTTDLGQDMAHAFFLELYDLTLGKRDSFSAEYIAIFASVTDADLTQARQKTFNFPPFK